MKKGDIGHHMYFVQMGEIEVLPDEDSQPVAYFKEGDIFGEVCLCMCLCACMCIHACVHTCMYMLECVCSGAS